MIRKLKKHSRLFGLAFTVAAGLFLTGMVWVAYFDELAYSRMQLFLFDCGIDAIGTLVAAGLFYGSVKRSVS